MGDEFMQSEHERDSDPEEGEYHFSDEGVYVTEEEEPKPTLVAEKSGLGAQFSSYRRFVILGGIFAGVLLVVYLVISPATTPPPTEITAEVAPVPSVATTRPLPAATVAAAPTIEKPTLPLLEKPLRTTVASTVAPQPATPVAAPPAQQMMATIQQDMAHAVSTLPASPLTMAAAQEPAAAAALPAAPPPSPAVPDKAVVDRLSALEDSNNKLIGQLNAEYAHKLAEFETQDKVLQDQVRALNAKVSGMEAQMNQLLQTLNKQNAPRPTDNATAITPPSEGNNTAPVILPSSSASPTSSSKSNYSVQAIIPGRAWLRTDAGETVTVAEGDLLKGLGRVTKIDPYDGTIQIDTGSKMIMLTYGNGDYA
jgi:hypothetical protein